MLLVWANAIVAPPEMLASRTIVASFIQVLPRGPPLILRRSNDTLEFPKRHDLVFLRVFLPYSPYAVGLLGVESQAARAGAASNKHEGDEAQQRSRRQELHKNYF